MTVLKVGGCVGGVCVCVMCGCVGVCGYVYVCGVCVHVCVVLCCVGDG